MRATLNADILCPGCGYVLHNENTKTMSCLTRACKYFSVKFNRPSVNLRISPGGGIGRRKGLKIPRQ